MMANTGGTGMTVTVLGGGEMGVFFANEEMMGVLSAHPATGETEIGSRRSSGVGSADAA
ncbi:hypothetical protein PF005_g3735 [Phytophthora fragariae]|uniref:Uncharacterized protein n=1 Tax=Phytophthora fragariae TaxID=53985 RepID=A0A6A4A7Y3_9STRA|nr:hypothetical protein PF003_g35075 [Phytophthora fragariae]KAE9025869.1 hypothetical protein PF011_g2847 [Phytophthora fragariae]KAE9132590.1 hypothetical protein PF007_g3668 [Phytophthora fragariae]KAE9152872.1 hypothetical protein PF006_g2960 [Phytophthora fragariae]KAE9229800.1 hypothetical protein PF005_g3735 [Phytophthora fragariae]